MELVTAYMDGSPNLQEVQTSQTTNSDIELHARKAKVSAAKHLEKIFLRFRAHDNPNIGASIS